MMKPVIEAIQNMSTDFSRAWVNCLLLVWNCCPCGCPRQYGIPESNDYIGRSNICLSSTHLSAHRDNILRTISRMHLIQHSVVEVDIILSCHGTGGRLGATINNMDTEVPTIDQGWLRSS